MLSGKPKDEVSRYLSESEQRLARAQAIAHLGDWEWDITTNVVQWSDELFRIYGFEPGEIAPDYSLVVEQMHPDSKNIFLQAIDKALKGEAPFEMDYTFFRRDGSEAVLHTIGQVFRDELGTPVRMAGTVQDITEQNQAEVKLRGSEDKFRTIFDSANDGILIADIAGNKFLDANRTICAMLGYSKEELLRLGISDIHPEESLPSVIENFESMTSGDHPLVTNIPIKRKDGLLFYADINSSLISMDGQECILGIFHDTTERLHSEDLLRAQGKRLAESQRIAHIGSWEHNLVTNEANWSEELFRLLGLDPANDNEDFNLFFSMVSPDDQPLLKKSIEETLKLRKPFNIDYRFLRNDGETRVMRAIAELIPDNSGELVVLSGTAQDITEQKEFEEKIQESEIYIRSILDSVDEGFIVVDHDYRVITANSAYCDQVGMPLNQVLGNFCYEVSHNNSRPCHEEGEDCSVKHVFETGSAYTTCHRHLGPNGDLIYVETKAFPLKDESGKVTRVIETVCNITEKRLLEEERLKVQKLEAIGTLAGGIAHDFNNLLQGIFGYISIAKQVSDNNDESIHALSEAEKALNLTVQLTKQLLTFSKGGEPQKKPVDLQKVIDNAVRFALSGSTSNWHISNKEKPWPVKADEGQITQVVQNIILNASQAMADGGRVDITTRNIESTHLDLVEGLEEGKYVEITIKDEGLGIDDKDLPRIFDPYFTTKEIGSGLGLATSFSIIKNHYGIIRCFSTPGEGTTFTIYLPASLKIYKRKQSQPISRTDINPAKVLIMDDDHMICNVAHKMLKKLGHSADSAANGEEAINKYQAAYEQEQPFNVVILDLTIRGGLGGIETLEQLIKIDPGIKAIISSGYANNEIISSSMDCGFAAFLNKPYDMNGLQSALQAALE
jgi:PAS domain S-box-containing protein